MENGDFDLKRELKQMGKDLQETFLTNISLNNTFMQNAGKFSVPDWKQMAGAKPSLKKKKKKKKKTKDYETTEAVADAVSEVLSDMQQDGQSGESKRPVRTSQAPRGDARYDMRQIRSAGDSKKGGMKQEYTKEKVMQPAGKTDFSEMRTAVKNADAARLQEAVAWAEILGEPMSLKRRKKRMNH